MRAWLRRYRLELKYTALTALVLGGLALVMRLNWLDGLEGWVNATMDRLVTYGYPGLFVIGLLANITLVFMIPYAIPLMTLSMYADSILEVIALGTAAGVGAGIGEITSYAVAHTLVRHVEDLEHSALFRWTKRTISRHPVVIPLFVWLASATPAPDAVIIATGSEVALAMGAAQALTDKKIRVISMPSTDTFDAQDETYKESVLPKSVPRVAVEAGVTAFWRKYVGLEGAVVGLDRFGESAPGDELFKYFGFTVDHVVEAVKSVL